MDLRLLFFSLFLASGFFSACSQADQPDALLGARGATGMRVIAYYSGDPEQIGRYPIGRLTHIIHSFLHLDGNRLALDDEQDSIALVRLRALKTDHPQLKVLLSLGGWGGCETCSEVFAEAANRKAFAVSVLDLLERFGADGIDLDWEYPAIPGYPEHRYVPEDKHNFTLLVRELREVLGNRYEISFAAGGFDQFLEESIEWKEVMPLLDNVNIMTYDLVNGYSTTTGHHTPLYSTPEQQLSVDRAIRFLDSVGVDRRKMIVGAAFYARVWEEVPPENNGLYQPGTFKQSVDYRQLDSFFVSNPGFELFWDSVAMAPYAYNPRKQLFATFDDPRSVAQKTQYVMNQNLGGIMFWQLRGDRFEDGLLNVIHKVKEGTYQWEAGKGE